MKDAAGMDEMAICQRGRRQWTKPLPVKLSRDTAKCMGCVGRHNLGSLDWLPRQAGCVAKERLTVVLRLAGGLIWQAGKPSGQVRVQDGANRYLDPDFAGKQPS